MMLIGTFSRNGCWKIFLELLVLAFSIGEISKLMLMRTNMCRSKIWIRKAIDGVSIEAPKSCILSTGAKLSFASIISNILCISLLSLSDKYQLIDNDDMDESCSSDVESEASLEKKKPKIPEIPKIINQREEYSQISAITRNENIDDESNLETKRAMMRRSSSSYDIKFDSKKSLLSSEASFLVRAGLNKHRERKNNRMNEATRNRVEAFMKAKEELDESENSSDRTGTSSIQI